MADEFAVLGICEGCEHQKCCKDDDVSVSFHGLGIQYNVLSWFYNVSTVSCTHGYTAANLCEDTTLLPIYSYVVLEKT